MQLKKNIQFLLLPIFLFGCSTVPEDSNANLESNKPNAKQQEQSTLDSYNESMHSFNKGFYKYVMKPIGSAVEFITPDFVEDAVFNMLDNLSVPNSALNNGLQGKFGSAGDDLARFGINTTVGLLGIFDVASVMGIESNEEDFGQTLAYYGVESGPYVVLPVLGGVTPRDMTGQFVAFDPINMTSDSAKKTVDNIGYVGMAIDAAEIGEYPSYQEQKEFFLASRTCSSHDGDESVKESCAVVCNKFSEMKQQELASAETEEEKHEIHEMSKSFFPSYCQSIIQADQHQEVEIQNIH